MNCIKFTFSFLEKKKHPKLRSPFLRYFNRIFCCGRHYTYSRFPFPLDTGILAYFLHPPLFYAYFTFQARLIEIGTRRKPCGLKRLGEGPTEGKRAKTFLDRNKYLMILEFQKHPLGGALQNSWQLNQYRQLKNTCVYHLAKLQDVQRLKIC